MNQLNLIISFKMNCKPREDKNQETTERNLIRERYTVQQKKMTFRFFLLLQTCNLCFLVNEVHFFKRIRKIRALIFVFSNLHHLTALIALLGLFCSVKSFFFTLHQGALPKFKWNSIYRVCRASGRFQYSTCLKNVCMYVYY